MEKVLLAIDGIRPDKKAFDYAIGLCQRIKAELKVLQIVGNRKSTGCLNTVTTRAKQAKRLFEGSMLATTFAEMGEFETADDLMAEALKNINKLLPESKKAGVPYDLMMKSGDARAEIADYIRRHRNVVIAVYDPAGEKCPNPEKKGKGNRLQSVLESLPVPVVMVEPNA